MKKTIITLAIAMAAICGSSAMAQRQADLPGNNNKMYQPREFTEFAFEGILLDINQQTRIDSLNATIKNCQPAECVEAQNCTKENCNKDAKECTKDCKKDGKDCAKAGKDCKKDGKDCAKAGKDCKKDGKDCPKAGKGMRPGANQCILANPEVRKNYIGKVKEILTPEQYTTFLENIVFMPQQMQAPMRHQPMMGHGRNIKVKDGNKAGREAGRMDRSQKMEKKAK